jgi:hypothetical protein
LSYGRRFEAQIIEVERPAMVAPRRQNDDARATSRLQRGPQTRGELKVSEMVRSQLQLETAGVACQRCRCHAAIVDEHVERLAAFIEPRRERIYRWWIGQIERDDFDVPNAGERSACLFERACADHDGGTPPRPAPLSSQARFRRGRR